MALGKPFEMTSSRRTDRRRAEQFQIGDTVVLKSIGVGQISARQEMSVGGQVTTCFVVDPPYGQSWYVPTENAADMIRHPVSLASAERILDVLRQGNVEEDCRPWKQRYLECKHVLENGNPFEAVDALRRLYAKKSGLLFEEGRMILLMEDLVLGELAITLGIKQEDLEAEMRARYPGFIRYATENPSRTPPKPSPIP
jgi:RNA polymerase-interacting CarD/CdnL/TRCF family regulator